MTILLTICSYCAQSRPDFLRTVDKLKHEFAENLRVNAVDCMAACDDAPAVMVEYDYIPRVSPEELHKRIEQRLEQGALLNYSK